MAERTSGCRDGDGAGAGRSSGIVVSTAAATAAATACGHPQRGKRQERDEAQQTHAAPSLLATSRRYDKSQKARKKQRVEECSASQGILVHLCRGSCGCDCQGPAGCRGWERTSRFRRQPCASVGHCLAEAAEWRDGQGRGPALAGSGHGNRRGIGRDFEILHVVGNRRRSRSGKVCVSAVCRCDGVRSPGQGAADKRSYA
jgi:hypothetical protein